MAKLRIGDHVEALKGKRQGQVGKVTTIKTGTVFVQFDGVQYEMSYEPIEVRLVKKATDEFTCLEKIPENLHGDEKLRVQDYLVKSGKLCPSWPYSCSGECEASNGRVKK